MMKMLMVTPTARTPPVTAAAKVPIWLSALSIGTIGNVKYTYNFVHYTIRIPCLYIGWRCMQVHVEIKVSSAEEDICVL